MAMWDASASRDGDGPNEQLLEAVVDEAYEVQTYQPFHGWVYDRYCDRSGNTFPVLTRAVAKMNGNATPNELREQDLSVKEVGALPSDEWMWSHPWLPDIEHCDEEGWTYGSTFARINRRLASGTLKLKREYYHFVRRRRWIRTRVRKPTLSAEGDGFNGPVVPGFNARDKGNYWDASDGDLIPTAVSSTPSTGSTRFFYAYQDSLLAHFVSPAPASPSSKLLHLIKKTYEDHDVLCEDWLGQRGSLSRSWKLRYFILLKSSSTLVCLRDCASRVAIREIGIDRYTSTTPEVSPNPNQFQFLVADGHHTMRLNALDERTREKWLMAITELIVRKRRSFDEADQDSDSVHNGMSSARHALSARASQRWQRPSYSKMPSRTLSDRDAAEHGHQKRKPAWRPYKLVSATMHCKRDVNDKVRRQYIADFEVEFTNLLGDARSFLEENLDILEANLHVAEQVLTAAVVRVPLDELKRLRDDVNICMLAMAGRLQILVTSNHANVLQCNMLRKALHVEARRLNEITMSFAPPVGQATVKKIAPDSPSKRRIPTDWFMGPTSISTDTSEESGRHATKADPVETQPVSKVVARPYDLTSNDSSSTLSMLSARRKRSSVDSSMASFLNSTVLLTTFAGKSEPVTIQAFRPLPVQLCEGHMELPDGVNGYVFLVHEHDLGSLISFTLCSKAYIDAVEVDFERKLDLARELKVEECTLGLPVPSDSKRRSESISSSAEIAYFDKLRYIGDVQHTEVKFSYESHSTKHEFRCVSFFASQFHALRALSGHGNVDFLCSLARSKRAESSGGKSGAFFSMTHDKRYVLKGIPMSEFNMFVHMAPHYFKFMSNLMKNGKPTVVTKILGLYKLTHMKKMHKHTTYVVVMENITYGFPPGQTYDIKGITRRRYSGPDSDDTHASCRSSPRFMIHDRPVLMDGDLVDQIPIPVRKLDLDDVEPAYQNDTDFLSRAGVIDYSLLMLFDNENRRVVVGLIDYLHQFDFLKKMESTSKASLTFRNPTIISPSSYRTRFVNAMHRYLVGIEVEVELRIRKRTDKKSSQKSAAVNGSTANAAGVHHACKPKPRLPDDAVPSDVPQQRRVERATSDGAVEICRDAVSFDRHATQAHSDGEQYDSDTSDEVCFRESPAVYGVLMPEEDHR